MEESPISEEVTKPVLLNTWKHHAGALRARIREAGEGGPSALAQMAGRLVVIGTELMDLYTGSLSSAAIAGKIIEQLALERRLALEAYRQWVADNGGYGVVTLDEDASRWVLRLGDEAGRYVHIHPARRAPNTRRVRANVLKTAVMVLAHVAVHGGNPMDVELVNKVRCLYLGLAPMGKDLTGDHGLGGLIDVLKSDRHNHEDTTEEDAE